MGSVLHEVANDESMPFPTCIPVDIPVGLFSQRHYFVHYSTQAMSKDTTFFAWILENLDQVYGPRLVILFIGDGLNVQNN